jgi:hypothetical protein
MQHVHVFGIGIVARESEIELGIERDHVGADAPQRLRREGAAVPLPQAATTLIGRDSLWPRGHRRDSARACRDDAT